MPNKRKKTRTHKHVHPWAARMALLWQRDLCYVQTVLSPVARLGSILLKRSAVLLRLPFAHLSVFFFVGMIAMSILVPSSVYADMDLFQSKKSSTLDYGSLPESALAIPRKTFTVPITAYTSDPRQTDDTPCITASGLDVCERGIENIVAANFLPLGTRVRIPELYGGRVFYVEDRMNARYTHRMDVWMEDINDAKTFGIKRVTVEVF